MLELQKVKKTPPPNVVLLFVFQPDRFKVIGQRAEGSDDVVAVLATTDPLLEGQFTRAVQHVCTVCRCNISLFPGSQRDN